jgi:hypothetical protein
MPSEKQPESGFTRFQAAFYA